MIHLTQAGQARSTNEIIIIKKEKKRNITFLDDDLPPW
jgi:hypothetical protein